MIAAEVGSAVGFESFDENRASGAAQAITHARKLSRMKSTPRPLSAGGAADGSAGGTAGGNEVKA
jgi:hypothetical protein